MRKNRIKLLVILLCVFGTLDTVKAQTDTTLRLEVSLDAMVFKENLKKTKNKVLQQAVDTFWIDGQSITVVCKKSSNNIIEKTISTVKASAVAHSVVAKPEKEEPQQTIMAEPKTKDNTEQTSVAEPKTKDKYDPDIDKFLNIEDESIFSDSKFKTISKQQVHPRSYKYYCLISDIYEFRKKVEKATQLGFQQVEQAKTLVDEMSSLAEQIMGDDFSSERQMLTKKQKDYYNQLYNQYEKLWYFFNK